jgi:hypothetical protein
MAIQGVKGAPGTVYVIKGNVDPMTLGQQFAQTVSQAKYKQLQMAQEAAKLQLQSDMKAYELKVRQGLATYEDELRLAQQQEKIRLDQIQDLTRLREKTNRDLTKMKIEAGTTTVGGGGGGSSTTTKLDPKQRELDRATKDKGESDRLIQAIDDKLKDPTLPPARRQQLEGQKTAQGEISTKLGTGIEKLEGEGYTPFAGRTIETTRSSSGSGRQKKLSKEAKAARDAEIKRLEDLLGETTTKISTLEVAETQRPTAPDFGPAPTMDLTGRTRLEGARLRGAPAPPPTRTDFDMGSQAGQREYLMSFLEEPKGSMPPRLSQGQAQEFFATGMKPEEYDLREQMRGDVSMRTEPLGSFSPALEPTPLEDSPAIMEPTAGPAPMDLLQQPAGSMDVGQPLPFAQAQQLGRTVPPTPPEPVDPYAQRRQEFEAMGLSIDELAAPPSTPQGQPVTMDKTRQQKRDSAAIDTISSGMAIAEEDLSAKVNAEEKTETTKMVLSLYNPPKDTSKDKRDQLFTNAYRELEVFYKDKPEKMKEAQQLLVALHFMNE